MKAQMKLRTITDAAVKPGRFLLYFMQTRTSRVSCMIIQKLEDEKEDIHSRPTVILVWERHRIGTGFHQHNTFCIKTFEKKGCKYFNCDASSAQFSCFFFFVFFAENIPSIRERETLPFFWSKVRKIQISKLGSLFFLSFSNCHTFRKTENYEGHKKSVR